MTTHFNLHRAIAFSLNLIGVGLIIYLIFKTDSDKSLIIFLLGYPALFLINLVLFVVLKVIKSNHSVIYFQALLGLLALVAPVIYIISHL